MVRNTKQNRRPNSAKSGATAFGRDFTCEHQIQPQTLTAQFCSFDV